MALVPIGLHECRHTFVSLMVAAGRSLEEVGDYVGHSSRIHDRPLPAPARRRARGGRRGARLVTLVCGYPMTASHLDTGMLIAGFESAVARATGGIGSSFEAVFESLAWAGAIRDRLAQTQQLIPPVVNGLWFVRNLAIHQGADVVAIVATYGSAT